MKIAFFDVYDQDEKEKENFYKSELKDHQLFFYENSLSTKNLPNELDVEILSIRSKSQATKEVLEKFPNLKFITLRITGFNNVDLNYAKSKNITVSNVPAYGSHTVAEFALGLILSLSRNIPQAFIRTKQEKLFNYQGLRGFDLFEKTLGVIGTGKIGANVIKMAKAFGMTVLAYDIYPNEELSEELGFKYVELAELLNNANIITIHTPSTPETHHLINQNNINQIKKGAVLINTARGDIIETSALIKALEDGIISKVALDVLEEESSMQEGSEDEIISNNKKLMEMPKVLVTPHMAFYTNEAEQSIMETTIENIMSFVGGSPKNTV